MESAQTTLGDQNVITTQPQMDPENQKKKDETIGGALAAEMVGDVGDGIADGMMFNALLNSNVANASGADCGNCGDCGDCDCCCGPDDCDCDCCDGCDCDCGDCGGCDCGDCGGCDCGDCGGCDCGDCSGCGDCTIL